MTLKEGFEGNFLYISGQMDSTNIEVGVIREDKKFHVLTPSQIKEYLDELQ
jgi:20S proteasome subunit alpha 2